MLAWVVAAIVLSLNARLTYDTVRQWQQSIGGGAGWAITIACAAIALGLGALLLWMIFRPERQIVATEPPSATQVAAAAEALRRRFTRIGVALEARADDASMLAEAIALARVHRAALVLMHVVEGVGGQFHGRDAADAESHHDETYLRDLADHLRTELAADGIPDVTFALGYGTVTRSLVQLATDHQVDLLVVGGHGHGRLKDLLRGETINSVRHALPIPMLAVRPPG
jgi:manganese transport protein